MPVRGIPASVESMPASGCWGGNALAPSRQAGALLFL